MNSADFKKSKALASSGCFPNSPRDKNGFALVVTLSLMVLLTIIAVGSLSLSAVTVRSSSQGRALSEARANARLALMIALGELQRAAGSDKVATATSAIVSNNPAKHNLTGVWDSWDTDPTAGSVNYAGPKTLQSAPGSPGFRRWLVSDSNAAASATRDYVNSPFIGDTIELVGSGSLGITNPSASSLVRAGIVPVKRDGKKIGNYAWHVSDESVKARFNAYRDPSLNQTLAQKRALLSGHRPDLSAVAGLSALPSDSTKVSYDNAIGLSGKLVTFAQTSLLAGSPNLGAMRHDITPHSLGLLTNAREGGLKTDLTSLFSLSPLPAPYDTGTLYDPAPFASGSSVTGISAPRWSALAEYHNIYKDLITPETAPTLSKVPMDNISLTTPQVPTGYSPGPVIAKVEIVFSLVASDKYGSNAWRDGDYVMIFVFTPVITLHNPYNVNIQFDRMKIGIQDVPIGFKFYLNGLHQTYGVPPKTSFTSLADLYYTGTKKKEFWLDLGNWNSTTDSSPVSSIVMKPGQSLTFSPIALGSDWNDDATGGNTPDKPPVKARPGYAGKNIGFALDWLVKDFLMLKKTDGVAVEFSSLAPPNIPGKPLSDRFNVIATLTANGITREYGGLSFIFGSQATLDKLKIGTLRYPSSGTVTAGSMHTLAKAFAVFSAYARTANGGVYETGERTPVVNALNRLADGRLAGNPFLHQNPGRNHVSTDLTTEKPGYQSHEMNFIALSGETDDAFTISADNRTNILANYRQVAEKSIKSGSLFEIPSGPLQTIADFRRSNALSSPFLPAFVQPVANSYASPLMDTDKVKQVGPSGYDLLDHSYLANHALYDRTYFSTITAADFNSFMATGKPLANQIFQPYLPVGTTLADASLKALTAASAPGSAASYQIVKAPFNVNSTSVTAWKAMLSSLSGSQVNTLWARSGLLETLPAGANTPIPAMTLHSGSDTSAATDPANIDDQTGNQWNGYRSFSEAEIDLLAKKIVDQVRLRGPFLSLAEFVNRRIGPTSQLTLTGALQNAIDDAGLNSSVFQNHKKVTEEHVSDGNLYDFPTPAAATGNPAAGAPGWLSQGDIMKILGPAATVRSDTFVIRVCGQATNANGDILATAYAEALVQRQPEYLDPTDPPTARPAGPGIVTNIQTPALTSPTNLNFGRRFSVVSFRWLNKEEI